VAAAKILMNMGDLSVPSMAAPPQMVTVYPLLPFGIARASGE
jgi:hypothetical protein